MASVTKLTFRGLHVRRDFGHHEVAGPRLGVQKAHSQFIMLSLRRPERYNHATLEMEQSQNQGNKKLCHLEKLEFLVARQASASLPR